MLLHNAIGQLYSPESLGRHATYLLLELALDHIPVHLELTEAIEYHVAAPDFLPLEVTGSGSYGGVEGAFVLDHHVVDIQPW
jgi:hypothetical protein